MEELTQRERDAAALVLEQQLLERLKLMVEWLKFAEAKNAALVTLAASGFLVLVKALPPIAGEWAAWANLLTALALLGLAAGLLIALVAFMPQVRQVDPRPTARTDHTDRPNFDFYGPLGTRDKGALAQLLAESHAVRRGELPDEPLRQFVAQYQRESHQHLAEQIVEVARIASRKFALFRWAAWCVVLALLPILLLFALAFLAPGAPPQ